MASIPHIFAALIEEAAHHPDRLEVDYDALSGFPTRVYIDRMTDVVDDEVRFAIWDFRLLP